jgi:hypothetical protein
VNAIPALAAAMAAILLQLRPKDPALTEGEQDELRLWLVAAVLAALVR